MPATATSPRTSRSDGCAMPEAPRMIYWDSCIFLHYIAGSSEWMPILDSLLDQASRTGEIVIATSTISIVEVAFAKTE